MTRADLEALASRVEALQGPDREVDAEIAAAVRYFPKGVGFVWQGGLKANSPEHGRVECCTSLGTGGPHYAAPKFTASLDAAMTLVPKGWNWSVNTEERGAWCWKGSDFDMIDAQATTPALALCAAALRAHAKEASDAE